MWRKALSDADTESVICTCALVGVSQVSGITDNKLDATKLGIIAMFDKELCIISAIGAAIINNDADSANNYIYVLESAKNKSIDGDSIGGVWGTYDQRPY